MVLHGPGLHPWPYALGRGAEVLGEMARHFQEMLLLDEECGQAAWMGRQGLRQGDAASVVAAFLTGGVDLCLLVDSPCSSAEAAGAVAAAWRCGAWIQRVGDAPCELEALVKASVPGDATDVLDDLWESFTGGPLPLDS